MEYLYWLWMFASGLHKKYVEIQKKNKINCRNTLYWINELYRISFNMPNVFWFIYIIFLHINTQEDETTTRNCTFINIELY